MSPPLLTEERRKEVFALAILFAIPTLFFLDVLLGVRAFYIRDISNCHHALAEILRRIVLGGEFPYWNPWTSAGQPIAANPQYQVFYPLTWLILLPSFELGFQLLILSHIYIATFGMYALLRSMKIGRPAACFGALGFGLGGVVLSASNLFPTFFSLAWLPLTCLFARRYLRDRSRLAFALAALFLGLQLLIGEPSTALQSGLLIGMYAVRRGTEDGGLRDVARHVAAVARISIAALLIAAVQLLPAVDHFGDSVRSRGFALEQVGSWSMPLARVLEPIFPDLLGDPLTSNNADYWGPRLYPNRLLPYFFGIYSGLLLALTAAAGVATRKKGAGLAAVCVVVSIALAAGSNTPLLRLLYDLHVAPYLRYPEKFVLMGVFAMVVFGAAMLDRLLEGDRDLRRMTSLLAAEVAAMALVAAILTSTAPYARWFRGGFDVPAGLDVRPMITASLRGWLIAAVTALALFALIRAQEKMRPRVFLLLLSAFMLLDLGRHVPRLAPRMPSEYYAPSAAAKGFRPNRDAFRVFHYAAWDARNPDGRQYFSGGPDLYWLFRNAFTPPRPSGRGVRTVLESDYGATDLLPTTDFTRSAWELSRAQPAGWIDTVASMSNVWYVGIYRPFEKAVADARGEMRDVQPVTFIEGRHNPRYYFATEIVTIRDRRDFVHQLAGGKHDRYAAFIEAPSFTAARGTVREWRETANTARIDVESAGIGFLVMSVTPHKDWSIAIDGRESRAIVTNIGYQGVVIPPGRHVVTMRYRNPLIPIGAVISFVTLVLLGARALRPGSAGVSPARVDPDS